MLLLAATHKNVEQSRVETSPHGSVWLEMPACWQTQHKIHRTDQFTGKWYQTDKINESILIKETEI